jgi:dephospho-CoA kinase
MIILAIAGSLCAGKKTAADYLQICYGFKVFNLESDEWLKEGNFSSTS